MSHGFKSNKKHIFIIPMIFIFSFHFKFDNNSKNVLKTGKIKF